jgi:GAF domain-containing protein
VDILFVTPGGQDRHEIAAHLAETGLALRVHAPTRLCLQGTILRPPALLIFEASPREPEALEFARQLLQSSPQVPCLGLIEEGDADFFDEVLECAQDALALPVVPSLLRLKVVRVVAPREAPPAARPRLAQGFAPGLSSERRSETYLLADLLQDGRVRLETAIGGGDLVAFSRAFLGLPRARRIEACLDAILARLGVEDVALFTSGPGNRLQLGAVRPASREARRLEEIAARVWKAQDGLIETGATSDATLAAVPVVLPGRPLGVLAASCARGGRRLVREDLAILAALGERIGRTLTAA